MRRLFWLGVGAAAGASGTVWAQQQVRRRVEQLGPEHVAVVAAGAARRVGRHVADAVSEGRTAMRDRELDLRRQLGHPDPPAPAVPPTQVHRTAPARRPTRPAGWDRPR